MNTSYKIAIDNAKKELGMRTKWLSIPVSPEEKTKAKAVASSFKGGVSMSDYIRIRIAEDYEAMKSINTGKTQIDVSALGMQS